MFELYDTIARLSAEGRPFVLATVVDSQGSTPQKPGAKLVVLEGGTIHGTVGGGAIEKQIIDAAVALLADPEAQTRFVETHLTHELGMCCGGKMRVFLEKHAAAARLLVFGAGHVSQALAKLAAEVGFDVEVVDERPEWAAPERFPRARLTRRPPEQLAREQQGGPDRYYCITTHDHPLDQACLEALIRTPSAYLGVIGSRRKAEKFRARLKAQGFTEAELERVRCPMGVAIHALTPGEIAVSIVAELIAVRRRRER
ncbi:MAG: xanthine dehydrogenase accessory protein XdhC [Myxococcaceae bacterium]|nr:xanthine dehydrogenase accessory protein XdhC [Myxococcaceae bacterium]